MGWLGQKSRARTKICVRSKEFGWYFWVEHHHTPRLYCVRDRRAHVNTFERARARRGGTREACWWLLLRWWQAGGSSLCAVARVSFAHTHAQAVARYTHTLYYHNTHYTHTLCTLHGRRNAGRFGSFSPQYTTHSARVTILYCV